MRILMKLGYNLWLLPKGASIETFADLIGRSELVLSSGYGENRKLIRSTESLDFFFEVLPDGIAKVSEPEPKEKKEEEKDA